MWNIVLVWWKSLSIRRILGTQTFLFVFWTTTIVDNSMEIKSALVLLHLVATILLFLIIILVIIILELR